MNLKQLGQVLTDAGRAWSDDKAPRLGAALAYYSVFSLAPLLLIAIGLCGLIFGEQAARGEILGQIRSTVGDTAAAAIEDLLRHAGQPGAGSAATVIGLVVLFFGASGVFVELQDALNTIWKVKPRPGLGIWDMIRTRLLSFAVILATGFLLLVSLAVSATLVIVGDFVRPAAERILGGPWLWLGLHTAVTFALVTLLFALIYKVLPDAEIGWRDVWLGAALAALLFSAGKYGIGLYLAYSGLTSAFGAAGSVIVILIWVYWSAQILLFGAEVTRARALRAGSHIVPSRHAVPVTHDDLARQGLDAPPDRRPGAENVPQPAD
jgi:membrane protein